MKLFTPLKQKPLSIEEKIETGVSGALKHSTHQHNDAPDAENKAAMRAFGPTEVD